MRIILGFSSLIFLLFTLLGCSGQVIPSDIPDINVPIEEINDRLHLFAPEGWNSFKVGDIVNLEVTVVSDDMVAFYHNYDVRIFTRKEDIWVEIPNNMKYPEGYLLLSPSKGNPHNAGEANLAPALSDKNKPVTLRIFVVGYLYENGQITDKKTAAYIDVNLKP